MTRAANALAPATKALAMGSLLVAVSYGSWLGRAAWMPLPYAAMVAGIAGCVGARLAPWPVLAGILFFTYLTPAIVLLAVGRFSVELLLVWSAAVMGVILGDRDRWQWSYPSGWRFVLVLWALTVAIAWPITALREADFESLALLQRYNIPNTGVGGGPRIVILWGLDTAIIHLLGLLWFDWLFRHASRLTDAAFERWIGWPLAASIMAGSLLAIYQGLIDPTLLTVGVWASLHRAPGSLLDANAFGAAAAMWTVGLLAFVAPTRLGRAGTLAGVAVCWGGLWMSGSRTALAVACIALAFVCQAALRQAFVTHSRRLLIPAVSVIALVAVAGVLVLVPSAPESPLGRLRRTLPADVSEASARAFAREMWNRNGYGEAATNLIANHPLTGVGIGLFNLSGSADARARGLNLPADNAQNWWRHHIAELGLVGAAGLLLWTAVFLAFLARTSGDAERAVPAAALKGALIGFGVVSLVGMPAQSLPVTMTFWTCAFWYTRLISRASNANHVDAPRSASWVLLLTVVALYGVTLLVLARGHERPAMRAALGQWRYTYGVYDPGITVEGQTLRWTERHGVGVVPNDAPWMILTVRAEHPDLRDRPVHAVVEVNGRTVVDRSFQTHDPVIRAIETGSSGRVIIETRVDRTWRPPGVPARHPDVGLSLSWTFGEVRPMGVPAVTAPLRR